MWVLSAPYDASQRFLQENKLSDKNLRLTSKPSQGYTSCHGKNNAFFKAQKPKFAIDLIVLHCSGNQIV